MINDKRFGSALVQFTAITTDAQQKQAYLDHTGYPPKHSWKWKYWRPKTKSRSAKVGLEFNYLEAKSLTVLIKATATNNTLFAGWMKECQSFTLPFITTLPAVDTENNQAIIVNTVCSDSNVCFELFLPYWDPSEPGNNVNHAITHHGSKLVVYGNVTRPDAWDVDGWTPTTRTNWRYPPKYTFRRIFNIPSIVSKTSPCKQVHKPGCCILVLQRT
jgi:hypothetical protein